MGKIFSLLSFLAAIFAIGLFASGFSGGSLGLRWLGSGLAVTGVWLGDRGARRYKEVNASSAAMLNVFALLGMGVFSLYAYFAN